MIEQRRIRMSQLVQDPHRQDLGDIGGLADDIAVHGVQTRPTVTTDMRVLGGERVIAALNMLNDQWVTVDVVDSVEDAEALLVRDGEKKEVFYKEKTLYEKMLLANKLAAFDEHNRAERRAEASMRGRSAPGSLPQRQSPSYVIARIVGWSNATYSRIRIVWRTAYGPERQIPEIRKLARFLFQEVAAGKVTASYARNRLAAEAGISTGRRPTKDAELEDSPIVAGDRLEDDPDRERVAAAQRKLAAMHHRTRSSAEVAAVQRLDRFADQLAGLALGVGSLVDGDYPLIMLNIDHGKVVQVKRNLREARAALAKLANALNINERIHKDVQDTTEESS